MTVFLKPIFNKSFVWIQDSFKIDAYFGEMKILLIEDEVDIAQSVSDYLKPHHIVVEVVHTLHDGIVKIHDFVYDCVVLDLGLPDGNGFEIIRSIKSNHLTAGIIVTSAKEHIDTRIEAMQIGADDYLVKPFHLGELLVRIQALIRRKNFNGNTEITIDKMVIRPLAASVSVDGNELDLTKKEFELLLFLIGNRGQVVSKSAIAEHISGDLADLFDNHDFIYAHIKNLKKKLDQVGFPEYIKTVYGIGYKWQE